jgi:RimJ/RimL family protein N-acetyltransferase
MSETLGVEFDKKEIGKGLVMRLLLEEDSARIAEILAQDPEIKKVVTWTAHISEPEDVSSAMADYRARGGIQLGFEKGGQLAVYIGILPLDFTGRDRDYGFGYFSAPESRRQGLVKEAMDATIEYAKDNFHPASLALYIADWNDSSQRVAEALDFRKTEEVFTDPILECDERRWERLP